MFSDIGSIRNFLEEYTHVSRRLTASERDQLIVALERLPTSEFETLIAENKLLPILIDNMPMAGIALMQTPEGIQYAKRILNVFHQKSCLPFIKSIKADAFLSKRGEAFFISYLRFVFDTLDENTSTHYRNFYLAEALALLDKAEKDPKCSKLVYLLICASLIKNEMYVEGSESSRLIRAIAAEIYSRFVPDATVDENLGYAARLIFGRDEVISMRNADGNTVLHIAAKDAPQLIPRLITMHFPLEPKTAKLMRATNSKRANFLHSFAEAHVPTAHIVLELAQSVNIDKIIIELLVAQDNNGETPLHIMVKNSFRGVAPLLSHLLRNLSPEKIHWLLTYVPDPKGVTLLQYAQNCLSYFERRNTTIDADMDPAHTGEIQAHIVQNKNIIRLIEDRRVEASQALNLLAIQAATSPAPTPPNNTGVAAPTVPSNPPLVMDDKPSWLEFGFSTIRYGFWLVIGWFQLIFGNTAAYEKAKKAFADHVTDRWASSFESDPKFEPPHGAMPDQRAASVTDTDNIAAPANGVSTLNLGPTVTVASLGFQSVSPTSSLK